MDWRVTEDASDDELYRWFVEALGERGSAREVEPDVILVVPHKEPEHYAWVHLTRAELQSVSWREHDIFDDTNDTGAQPVVDDPVRVGLITFAFFAEEMLDTLDDDEHHLVFHDQDLCRSVRRELPPMRGTPWTPPAGAIGSWHVADEAPSAEPGHRVPPEE